MNTVYADLHCHTTHSDGSATVAEAFRFAHEAGLGCLAITDHDTLAGYSEAARLARQYKMHTVQGAECSARDEKRGRPVHMLCYAPARPEILQRLLDETLHSRRETKLQMVDNIAALYPITREEVEAVRGVSASLYESHIMQVLAAKGYTNTVIGPLMDDLIGKNGSCYVPNRYPGVYRVIDTIHKAGGLAVLAHPGQFDSLPLVWELAAAGLLDGVECYHPRNSEAVQNEALAIAKQYGLLVTGGSDFHGAFAKKPHPAGHTGLARGDYDRFAARLPKTGLQK